MRLLGRSFGRRAKHENIDRYRFNSYGSLYAAGADVPVPVWGDSDLQRFPGTSGR